MAKGMSMMLINMNPLKLMVNRNIVKLKIMLNNIIAILNRNILNLT